MSAVECVYSGLDSHCHRRGGGGGSPVAIQVVWLIVVHAYSADDFLCAEWSQQSLLCSVVSTSSGV